jgi:dTDP-4-dehydrorhamnose 3,5-epimerase
MRRDIRDFNGLRILNSTNHSDERGRAYKYSIPSDPISQTLLVTENDNAATFRGMHIQIPPYSEEKIVKCIQGSILDFILDLREDSTSKGDWCAIKLTSESRDAILIPSGFAHGYQTLENNTKVLYLISGIYNPDASRTISFSDPKVNLELPLPISRISNRDSTGIGLDRYFEILKAE